MKEILLSIIDKIFEQVPFSKEEEILKKQLSDELILKYETDLDESVEIPTAIRLIAGCEDIESACDTAGCNADILHLTDTVRIKKIQKKYLKKQKDTFICSVYALL